MRIRRNRTHQEKADRDEQQQIGIHRRGTRAERRTLHRHVPQDVRKRGKHQTLIPHGRHKRRQIAGVRHPADSGIQRQIHRQTNQQQTAHAAQLASAKQEAAQIIEEARTRGQQEYDRLVAEAQTAVQRLDEQAARRRESERTQMLREAKKEITALVLLTTAKVSRQKLNSDTDRAMIDDFLREETEAAR